MSTSNDPTTDLEKGPPPIQLTPEQYERLFLQPGGRASINSTLATTRFANPTPLVIISYILMETPVACFLMGWGGSDTSSETTLVGAFYFIGGLGLVLAGVLEWVLGNTFPFAVFCIFGGFWLSMGILNDPLHGITSVYAGGATAPAHNKGIMFYLAFWAVLLFILFIGSLRTNVVFSLIFLTAVPTFICLSAAYGKLGNGEVEMARHLFKASGAFAWTNICCAWYLLTSLIMSIADMPFTLPVGDLSGFLKKTN